MVSEDSPPNDCVAVELDKDSIGVYNICPKYSRWSTHKMQRVNFHLTKNQIKALRQLSDGTGLSVAELIRRAIDEWLRHTERNDNGNQELQ